MTDPKQDEGRPGDADRATAAEPVVSALRDGIPDAGADLVAGQRVVLKPDSSRDYCTVVGPGSRDETIMLNVDGRYYNPQEHWRKDVVPAVAARDGVIGDLLNLDMLKEAIEQPFLGSLWTHGDSGMLTPYVCETSFGDGMLLLTISTINQRPNYHVVRVDSSWRGRCDWRHGFYREDTIGDHIDDVLTAIEEECGTGRCGYSGNSLFYPREERIGDCQCEECDDDHVSQWPELDYCGGCSWGEIRWDWLIKELRLTEGNSAVRQDAPQGGIQGDSND